MLDMIWTEYAMTFVRFVESLALDPAHKHFLQGLGWPLIVTAPVIIRLAIRAVARILLRRFVAHFAG
jgi:hypothetical protein